MSLIDINVLAFAYIIPPRPDNGFIGCFNADVAVDRLGKRRRISFAIFEMSAQPIRILLKFLLLVLIIQNENDEKSNVTNSIVNNSKNYFS